jgi:hypothetical protein
MLPPALQKAATAVNSVTGINPAEAVNATGSVAGALKQAAEGVSTKLAAASSATLASGLGNLPGGAGAAGALTNLSKSATDKLGSLGGKISGLKDAGSALKDKLGGASNKLGGALDKLKGGLKENLTSKLNGLSPPNLDIGAALAKTGLPSGIASQLESQLSAISSGGGVPVSMPVIAVNTTNREEITAAISNLLGDPGIPPPNMLGEVSESAVSEVEAAKKATTDNYLELGKLASKTKDAFYKAIKLEKAFDKAKNTLPQGDPKIQAAYDAYMAASVEYSDNDKALKEFKKKYNI